MGAKECALPIRTFYGSINFITVLGMGVLHSFSEHLLFRMLAKFRFNISAQQNDCAAHFTCTERQCFD